MNKKHLFLLAAASVVLSGCSSIENGYREIRSTYFDSEPAVQEKTEKTVPTAELEQTARGPIIVQERRTEPVGARFKVYRTLDDGAIANVCKESDTDACTGMTVLLDERVDKMFYDEKTVYVTMPVVIGTYKYTERGGIRKTVPIVSDVKYFPNRKMEPLR